jgi:dethiobiotin synthetase
MSGFTIEEKEHSDSGVLLSAMGKEITTENLDAISPWRFAAPLSPHMAAEQENTTIPLEALVQFCQTAPADTLTLIEGVGGCMAPLNPQHTVLDWMIALNIPVIVVVGSYLGTISHTLTCLDVLASRHIAVAAVVVSESEGSKVDLQETVATIRGFNPTTAPIVALPRSTPHDILDQLLTLMLMETTTS